MDWNTVDINTDIKDIANIIKHKAITRITSVHSVTDDFMKKDMRDYITDKNTDKHTTCSFASIYDTSNIKFIRNALTPLSGIRSVHFILDTTNVFDTMEDRWIFNVIRNYNIQKGGVYIPEDLGNNLIAMRIYPMHAHITRSPSAYYPPEYAGGTNLDPKVISSNPPTVYTDDFPALYSTCGVLIREFEPQASRMQNGNSYHFNLYPQLMNPEKSPDNYSWMPQNPEFECITISRNNGWFWFTNPIRNIFTTLTITLYDPFNYIPTSKVDRMIIPLEFCFVNDT